MMDWKRPVPKDTAHSRITCFVRVDGKGALSPVSYYRGYLPAYFLGTLGSYRARVLSQDNLEWVLKSFGERSDRALEADIFMVSRLYRREGLDLFMDKVHSLGGLAVFDTDDDLTEEFRALDGRGDEFIYTMGSMDAVTASTPYLASRMREYLKRDVTVLPNHIDVGWFSQVSRLGQRLPQLDGITVGMLGTSSHYGDWHYPVDALKRLKRELNGKLTVIVGGFVPDYLHDVALSIAAVPYSQYPVMVRQFDIVLCSLDGNDRFNLSKSAVKALEAMASARPVGAVLGGAVPVCTDMPVYRRAIVHGKNGFLVRDNDWYSIIKELVTNDQLRQRVSCAGLKWVTKNRDMHTGWKRWSRLYHSLRRR